MKKRKRFLIFSVIAACAISIGVVSLLIFNPPTLGKKICKDDFDSREQLMSFLNAHLPVNLPDDAEVITLEYDSWIEWDLIAEIKLTPESTKHFTAKISERKTDEVELIKNKSFSEYEFKYILKKSNAICTLEVDPVTGIGSLECGSHN